MRKEKLPYAGIKGKAVYPFTGGINQHGAGTVDDVAGRHLIASPLQQICHVALLALACPAVNGKDGTDTDVDINIG